MVIKTCYNVLGMSLNPMVFCHSPDTCNNKYSFSQNIFPVSANCFFIAHKFEFITIGIRPFTQNQSGILYKTYKRYLTCIQHFQVFGLLSWYSQNHIKQQVLNQIGSLFAALMQTSSQNTTLFATTSIYIYIQNSVHRHSVHLPSH